MRATWIMTGAALLLSVTPLAAQVTKTDLDIHPDKKTTLKASYYDPGKPGPGMLLLHQCNGDRTSWDKFARKLAAEGIHVLTFDFRGYGESTGADQRAPVQRRVQKKWPTDVDFAYLALLQQEGVDTKRMGAGGASCGVHQAIHLSLRHPEVRTLVLLSGRTDQTGAVHIRDAADLAVFGSASEEDKRPAEYMEKLLELSKNENSRMVMNKYAGHGVPMFRAIPTLMPEIVEWVRGRLFVSDQNSD